MIFVMGKPENYIESYLKTKAEEIGFLCYKFVSPANDGVPDRIIIGNNITIFVETKAPGEKARDLQKKTINDMIDKGAYVYVIDNRPDIDKLLLRMQKGKLPKPKKFKIEKIKL